MEINQQETTDIIVSSETEIAQLEQKIETLKQKCTDRKLYQEKYNVMIIKEVNMIMDIVKFINE